MTLALDGRLTTLQAKVDQLLELTKEHEGKNLAGGESETPMTRNSRGEKVIDYFSLPIRSPQAEIRSLELWKAVVAECLGTLCYVFFVCSVSVPWTGHFPPFLSIAFASALAYGTLTYQVFPGSQLNPAFTLALASIKCISPLRSILFLTAQSGGAIAGAALLYGLTVPGYQGSLGATILASHVTPVQAFGMEFILSFVITLTFMADPRNSLPTTAALLAANLVALPCTGAGLNPVRSLGPAFVMNKWPSHWVFWLGPILGAFLAAYLHKYILRRSPKKGKKVRESTSDGDSLDLPTAALPTTTHDRLLTERFEPLYGGTRSLYMKPSPVLPRTNLSRSQSVYASKRLEYNTSKFETLRKQLTQPHSSSGPHSHHGHSHHHPCSDSSTNYESLYERKSCGAQHSAQPPSTNLLMSGPPSYESNYYKTYDMTAPPSEKGHRSGGGHHHKREPSDLRDNHTNRILAQYETSKGLIDVDPKAAMKSHKSSLFYESEYSHSTKEKREGKCGGGNGSNGNTMDKKVIDNSSNNDGGEEHPPPPPRFRMQMSSTLPQTRYPPPGQCSGDLASKNDFSHHGHNHLNGGCGGGGSSTGTHGKDLNLSTFPKKPYELLDNPTRKLLDFSPNHSQPNSSSLTSPNSTANSNSNSSSNYTARLLMAEKDSTYSRILEPLMNSKPLPPGTNSNGNNFARMSPHDQFMYSYH